MVLLFTKQIMVKRLIVTYKNRFLITILSEVTSVYSLKIQPNYANIFFKEFIKVVPCLLMEKVKMNWKSVKCVLW
jgi:hypothetical protein